MKKVIVYLLIALISLFVLAGCSKEPAKYNAFAQCLTDSGATMYGTEWCSHCKNQKAAFGSSFRLVDYVDCDKKRNECLSAGIEGYPTWVIDGQNYPGEQPLPRLAELAGCELVEDPVE